MKKKPKVGFLVENTLRKGGRTRVGKANERSSRSFGGREYYLLSNTGSENRVLFSSQEDFDRFEAYLFLFNSTESPRVANFFLHGRERTIFETGRGDLLVGIGAYSITPKGFYLLVTPISEKGIGKFMQKLQTGYTMYFNKKYGHSGRVLHAAYRSQRAEDDEMLKLFFTQTHLEPAVLFDQEWHETAKDSIATYARRITAYKYSSIKEYDAKKFVITSPAVYPNYIVRMHSPQKYASIWTRRRKNTLRSRL